jgi:sialate O-acetylesterase
MTAAVRYGWTNVPEVNLFNQEGLPASLFRTDGVVCEPKIILHPVTP